VPPRALDGGPATCRLVRGPIELPVRGPAALVADNDEVRVVLNAEGRPRVLSWPLGDPRRSRSAGPEPDGDGTVAGPAAGCAVAGGFVFCPDRTGAVYRSTLDGADGHLVGHSRAGTRIAADLLGGTHPAVAYLASRKTSEGWMSEAWVVVDDDPPVRVSEDGSGATGIDLHRRGASTLAIMVDARAALTALHVRSIDVSAAPGAKMHVGDDFVVFVGGPGDRGMVATFAASPAGSAWALLPTARDVGAFGLAVVTLDAAPRVDEPVVWSLYPNGLDPAPTAAATSADSVWVARARPLTAEPHSERVIELGQITSDGEFAARDIVATHGSPLAVALAVDARGAVWLGWLDAAGSWLDRLWCR